MTKYAAFLRGINAGVNVKMQDLRKVFEGLGFTQVQTVISSGNVLFVAGAADISLLERRIEKALEKKLSIRSSVNVRTEEELKALTASQPFKNVVVTPTTRLYLTFLKKERTIQPFIPMGRTEKGCTILKITNGAIASIVDLAEGTTPDLMIMLDREFGKTITTRSWNTIDRALRKMERADP